MALIRAFVTVGGYTMISRVLGFVRDVLIAGFLGAGPVADAFFVAFKLPNLFRRLFAEGAFTAAFLPLFARQLELHGPGPARAFAAQALAVMLVVVLPFTVLAQALMPWVMALIAPGFTDDPATFDLAVYFSRLTFPYLLLMTMVGLLSAVLNGVYRFAAAAAAPILLNVILIAAVTVLTPALPTAGHALAWGVAAAGVGQFVWLAAACRRADMLPTLPAPRLSPHMRRLGRLMLPGAIGAGATQINLLVGTIFASQIGGAISWLYYADRVNQLPLGIVGVAMAAALLPLLSRQLRAGEDAAAMDSQNRAVEFAMLLTLPAAAACVAIPLPIVVVLFERGAFAAADARATAAALAAYALGLPAYVLIKAFQPGFFAREDTRTPVVLAVVSMAVNVALIPLLMWPFGYVGIALATAVASWLNAVALALALHRRGHLAFDRRLRRRAPLMAGACVVLGLALWAAAAALEAAWSASPATRIGALAALVVGGAALYFALLQAVGATRVQDLRAALARRRPAP